MSFGKYETWLDDGQLLSLDSDLPATDKLDILQSTLYFQLAASKKVDKFQQIEKWFDAYRKCLHGLGWSVLKEGHLQEQHPNVRAFTLSELMSSLGRQGLPVTLGDIPAVLRAGDARLTQLGLEHFSRQSIGAVNGHGAPLYQVAVLLGSATSGACMNVLLIHFKTHQPLSGDITQATFLSSSIHGKLTTAWLSARPDPLQFPDYQEVMRERLDMRTTGELVRVDRTQLRVRSGEDVTWR